MSSTQQRVDRFPLRRTPADAQNEAAARARWAGKADPGRPLFAGEFLTLAATALMIFVNIGQLTRELAEDGGGMFKC